MASVFNGSMKIKVCEATDLKPTDFATRLRPSIGSTKTVPTIDPYLSVDVDDIHVAKTSTKPKTLKPAWNEEFLSDIHNGQVINLTVFHNAAIPPDEFVANCTINFDEVTGKHKDIWVSIVWLNEYILVFELCYSWLCNTTVSRCIQHHCLIVISRWTPRDEIGCKRPQY